MKTILIVGATRNLGQALASHYVAEPNAIVYATSRYGKPLHHAPNAHWISNIDITKENSGTILSQHYDRDYPVDIVYIVAASSSSMFTEETLDSLKFEKELTMYKTSVIGPLFFIQQLLRAGVISQNTKIILIGTEAGSISLCTQGGNYGFHGSQAALNMAAKLLSIDLAPKGIPVGVVYPGLVIENRDRHHVNKDNELQFEVAAKALVTFVEKQFGMDKTGQLWATQGFKSIPALSVLAQMEPHEIPIQLPW